MKKADKIKFISKTLDELFPDPPIPLDYSDPYTLLVAVVLSAQCTDLRVNQVTKVLYKKAKTPKAMVKLGIEQIAEIIKPCGLSATKSKNIFNLSKILVEKYNGEVPRRKRMGKAPPANHPVRAHLLQGSRTQTRKLPYLQ